MVKEIKILRFRLLLSAICLASIMTGATKSNAAPVQFNQVLQIINAKPGKANTGGYAQLRLADDNLIISNDNDDKKTVPPQQDDRVITETRAEIVEEDVCDCEISAVAKRRFPYAWLALGAVPLLYLIPREKNNPILTVPTTKTLTLGTTPKPSTEPVPEPMTILLFGMGLASIGLAARRKFGKKDGDETKE